MSEQSSQRKDVSPSDLLDELKARTVRSDAAVMGDAMDMIVKLQQQVRARGRLLADIFNHPDVDLPADLHQRVDRTLMFSADTEKFSSRAERAGREPAPVRIES